MDFKKLMKGVGEIVKVKMSPASIVCPECGTDRKKTVRLVQGQFIKVVKCVCGNIEKSRKLDTEVEFDLEKAAEIVEDLLS